MDTTELLASIRNYLDITWSDGAGDQKLTGIIKRGIAFVQRLTTRELRFEEGTTERSLLFDYCMYARAGALDEFPKNYQKDILTFRTDEQVKEHDEKSEQDAPDTDL